MYMQKLKWIHMKWMSDQMKYAHEQFYKQAVCEQVTRRLKACLWQLTVKNKYAGFNRQSIRAEDNGWLLVEFHGISNTMGYSMPNPVYIYELYIVCNHFYMNSLFFCKLTFLFKFMFWSIRPTSKKIMNLLFKAMKKDFLNVMWRTLRLIVGGVHYFWEIIIYCPSKRLLGEVRIGYKSSNSTIVKICSFLLRKIVFFHLFTCQYVFQKSLIFSFIQSFSVWTQIIILTYYLFYFILPIFWWNNIPLFIFFRIIQKS